jgi:hypothetical protein
MIPLVSGNYVCYLCDDDIYYPNAFQTIVTSFEKNSESTQNNDTMFNKENSEILKLKKLI